MYKKFFIALSLCLWTVPHFSMAQQQGGGEVPTETTESPTAQEGATAGGNASFVARRAGGYGAVTKYVVAGAVLGGLAAVVLEAATDGSKDVGLPATDTSTSTSTSTSTNTNTNTSTNTSASTSTSTISTTTTTTSSSN